MDRRQLRVECLKIAAELRVAQASDAELMVRAETFEAWALAGESEEIASREGPADASRTRNEPGSAADPRPAGSRKDDRARARVSA